MNTKRVPHAILSAALKTPEEGVAKPERTVSYSATAQIAALKVGHSFTRVEQFPRHCSLNDVANNMAIDKRKLAQALASSAAYAKQKTGHEYRIETGHFITSAGNLYITAVVTRLADNA